MAIDLRLRPPMSTSLPKLALTFGLGLGLGLAGCTVGPNFQPPSSDAPAAYVDAPPQATVASPDLWSVPVERPFDGRRWWSVFHDPVLDGLVDEATRQNLDLQTAALRIAEARAQRDIAAGAELPTIAGSGIAGRTRMSENGIASALGGGSGGSTSGGDSTGSSNSTPSTTTNLFQVGFDALWELDLWGKTRRNVEAADASTLAAEQARGEAAVSLGAEVARTYLGLRGQQRQLAVLQADAVDQARLLRLIESSAHSGLSAQSDVAQQAAQLAATRAQLVPLEQSVRQAGNRLAALLALPPGALRERIGPVPPADAVLPPEVPIGLPGDLLRRRPDVLRSEAQLHAATAKVGVARAALFPSIELGASAGLQATRAGDLTDWASRFFVAGASISLPIFQGGRLRAQTRLADVQMQEAALDFRRTVLAAYHEADDALIAYVEEQRHARRIADQLGAARRGRDLAEARYRSGLAPLIDVLESDRTAHQAELASVQSSVMASTNLVALYKALGGDWNAPSDTSIDVR